MPPLSEIHVMPPLHFDLAVWLAIAAAFFTSMPWLVNLWFRRGYARHLLQPLARAHSVFGSRQGRLVGFVSLHAVNIAILATCIWVGCQLQLAGIGNLRTGAFGPWEALLLVPQVLLVLLVFDAQFYWVHRTAHRHPVLFRLLHREHHADRYPDAWSSMYQHPLDFFLATAMPMAWGVLLPVHEAAWWVALISAKVVTSVPSPSASSRMVMGTVMLSSPAAMRMLPVPPTV
jgi:sterol desaturase/sphingolipid hydroxylase (fatty acid hydroxylase superfamily)